MTKDEIKEQLLFAKTSFETQHLLEELRNLENNQETSKKTTEFHGDFKAMDDREQDTIINPAHYKVIPAGTYPNGLEYMDLMTYILAHHKGVESHLLGQILKYSIRIGKKDDKLQDAKKIQWYANYLVNVIEQENEL